MSRKMLFASFILLVCGWLMWLVIIPVVGSTEWANFSLLQTLECIGAVTVILLVLVLPITKVPVKAGPFIGAAVCIFIVVICCIVISLSLAMSFGIVTAW